MKFRWAVNQQKLQRAIAEAGKQEFESDEKKEKRVKELYISYGGLIGKVEVEIKGEGVIDENSNIQSTITEVSEEKEVVSEKPKKAGRPKKIITEQTV